MSENDVLFLVMILIGLSTLTLFIVQFIRSRRRGGGEGGRSGNWWEGPWDDDRR